MNENKNQKIIIIIIVKLNHKSWNSIFGFGILCALHTCVISFLQSCFPSCLLKQSAIHIQFGLYIFYYFCGVWYVVPDIIALNNNFVHLQFNCNVQMLFECNVLPACKSMSVKRNVLFLPWMVRAIEKWIFFFFFENSN